MIHELAQEDREFLDDFLSESEYHTYVESNFWQPGTNDISWFPEHRLLLVEYVSRHTKIDRYTVVVYRNNEELKIGLHESLALNRIDIMRWAIVPD